MDVIKKAILQEITDTTNDINDYLVSDVPLECHSKDIDSKMVNLKERISVLLEKLN